MRRIVPWFLFCFVYFGFAQDEETLPEQELNATVVNAQTDFPLESVHVINLNKVLGTITDPDGKFTITRICKRHPLSNLPWFQAPKNQGDQ